MSSLGCCFTKGPRVAESGSQDRKCAVGNEWGLDRSGRFQNAEIKAPASQKGWSEKPTRQLAFRALAPACLWHSRGAAQAWPSSQSWHGLELTKPGGLGSSLLLAGFLSGISLVSAYPSDS